jgi:hypothetical protein
MEKEFYSPACVLTCKEVCGGPGKHKKDPKCKTVHQVILRVAKKNCNISQGACAQGCLPDDFLFCPSADQDTLISFTTFKVSSVKTTYFLTYLD